MALAAIILYFSESVSLTSLDLESLGLQSRAVGRYGRWVEYRIVIIYTDTDVSNMIVMMMIMTAQIGEYTYRNYICRAD